MVVVGGVLMVHWNFVLASRLRPEYLYQLTITSGINSLLFWLRFARLVCQPITLDVFFADVGGVFR